MLVFMIFFVLLILLGVAFLTLLERNFLGLSQNRVSPNKSGFGGSVQAVFDGLKLLSKMTLKPVNSFSLYYYLAPGSMFMILFLEWLVIPFSSNCVSFNNSILFLLSLVGILVYFMLFSGLFSVSKYSLLGAIRSSSQSISFELAFFFFMFVIINYLKGLSFISSGLFIFNFLLSGAMFLLVLVELGRTPFDFPESESELVSGYNTEYSSVLFVLIFLSEYGFMIFFSVLLSGLFFNSSCVFIFLFIFFILFIRSVFPRTKFDHLMGFFWYLMLPLGMWGLLLMYTLL